MPDIVQRFRMKDSKSQLCGVNLVSLHAKRAFAPVTTILRLEKIKLLYDFFNNHLDPKKFTLKKIFPFNFVQNITKFHAFLDLEDIIIIEISQLQHRYFNT